MADKYSENARNPFSPAMALDSFRSHDFDPISAICEIIDNSQQAKANEIDIKFDWADNPEFPSPYAKHFVFIDNGKGMDANILYDYFILGEGEKRALSNGIGKFGVGGTLAGISLARHLEAYSKIKGGKWMYTYLDLDEITEGKFVPKPVQKDPPKKYDKDFDHGTIVIWDNVDKFNFTEDKVFEKTPTKDSQPHDEDILTTEIGRIYRKFLTKTKLEKGKIVKNTNPITIKIQNQEVEPYDPLYATYNPKSDDDKPKIKYMAKPVRYGNKSAKMHITTSYFPDSWWVDAYRPGLEKENRVERKIGSRSEGISLVREGREILFGKLPHMYIKDSESGVRGSHTFLEQDRFTGFEIEFGRDADDIFGIQVNKSKLNVRKEVRAAISNHISGTIVKRRQEWQEKRGEFAKKKKKGGAGDTGKGKKKIQDAIDPKYDDKQKEFLHNVAKKYVKDPKDQGSVEDAYADLVKGYLPVAKYDGDPTAPFVRFEMEIDSLIVIYNMKHPFLKKFTEALTEIGVKLGKNSEETLSVPENQTLRTLLDILFVSYGLASVSFSNLSKQQEIQTTINALRSSWGERANEFSRKNLESG